jgi:tetratricopeptide (TPR) repeat protein
MVCTVWVLADTLRLKDGTVLEGKVIEQPDRYWIKLADGTSKTVLKKDVASLERGDAKPKVPGSDIKAPPPPPAPANGAKGAISGNSMPIGGASAGAGAAAAGTSPAFAAVKSKADRAEAPVIAQQLWDKFIESNPPPADLAAAKAEKEKWDALAKENAEKINGKWVGGEERKKLIKEYKEMVKQGYEEVHGNQYVEGLKKLEKAQAMYPQGFDANFELGYFHLHRGVIGSNGQGNLSEIDKGIKALEAAQRVLPNSPATLSNLAIGYNFRKRYEDSVLVAYRAAKIQDTKDIVQNLVNAIAYAPRGMQQSNQKVKPIMEDAIQMAQKHGLSLEGSGSWPYIRPSENDKEPEPGEEKAPPGAAWAGSGFFVTDDGYIITNHHVATGDPKTAIQKDISFRVTFDDGSQKTAELIAIDENADIALMKVKVDSPVPFLKVADANPNQAAKALVLGYPATGEDKPTMQISEGSVKSVHPGGEHEVWFDLNTTHGNSGGPIVDRGCRVIGILTSGWHEYNMWIVGGVGPLQIKSFLEKIGDKAPKLEYVALSESAGDFNGEKLTEQARKCTLHILAIRGVPENGEGGGGKPSTGAGEGKSGND